MKTYSDQYVSAEERELFSLIQKVVSLLVVPDLGQNNKGEDVVLSCHILARATAKVFELKHVDGYFVSCYCHSWLITLSGHVIDVYPVGVLGGPVLWVNARNAPTPRLFQKRRLGNGNINSDQSWFRRSVRRVEVALRKLKLEHE
ncbi:MAG: hypothetical protein NTV48_01225 [Candidatus Vogelbacteria bacterium]|nr:hypothetical protein [Candidatus Vogelbacteria bacterium]